MKTPDINTIFLFFLTKYFWPLALPLHLCKHIELAGKYHEIYIRRRGGWPSAELHYVWILQYASVYTISRAVRTSGDLD